MASNDETLRRYMERRRSAMELERLSFIDQYKALSDFMKPKRGRFLVTDRNNGRRRWSNIINSHASQALRTATAGLFNGMMSPTRPYFWLGTDDEDRNEFGPHKMWLWELQEELRRSFLRSNLYQAAPTMIGEMLLFGTGCISHIDHPTKLMRFYTHTVGSYVLGQNDDGEVDTVGRHFEMTVEQIVRQFSRSPRDINPNISAAVRSAYARGNYDSWYPVVQFADPNPRAGMSRKQDRAYGGRPYRSSYYEPGHVDKDAFLEQKGFHEFPFYSPRWEVTGEDIYATECPGIMALGDVRGLQLEEKRKAQGIDKMVAPPVHGPPSLATKPVNLLPDGGTFYDAAGSQGLKAVYEVNLRIDEIRADIEAVERRIDNAFHVDLFKAITDMAGIQPRNELELMQRNQERLLQLGPMIERAQSELFDKLIDRGLNQLFRAGRIRPAPEGLQGRPIKAQYVSTLAMAQQAVTTGNIDRMLALVSNMAATQHPDFMRAADKLVPEQIIDEYGSLIGAPPSIIRSDDDIAKKREAEDQQAQQDRQLQQAQVGADAAAKLGQIKKDSIGGEAFEQAQEAVSGG